MVHIAPAFGVEDYNAVAQFLPRDDSKNRLFLPVNEYGEFTDEVPERKGIRVYDANKEIIQYLKEQKRLIGQRSYEHSYPHCRRCDTPLISKALTSRFIKEPSLTPLTVPHAEEIGFVPESVKKRFIDVLKTAPDRNLARNRYRGSPIPVWENTKDPEDIIVCGTLEEIYQATRTGSKNITKNIIIRHGETVYNETRTHDSYSKTELNKNGIKQAEEISKKLKDIKDDDRVIIVSPLTRSLQTILPFIQEVFADTIKDIEAKYAEIQRNYQKLRDEKKIIGYLQDPKAEKLFKINDRLYVDFRSTDIILPEHQGKIYPEGLSISKPTDERLSPEGESMNEVIARCKAYTIDINTKFATKTVISITHKDTVTIMHQTFKYFDYLTKKYEYTPKNGQISTRYRDNDRMMEMDLHKPYVDNYRFKK